MWCLWARSLYILATSTIKNEKEKSESKTLQKEEQTQNPFWCVLLQPTVLSAPPTFQFSQWMPRCGEVGGASAAEGQRRRRSIAPTREAAPGLCLVHVNELHRLLQRCGRILGRCYFFTLSSWDSVSSQVTGSVRALEWEGNKIQPCLMCVCARVCGCVCVSVTDSERRAAVRSQLSAWALIILGEIKCIKLNMTFIE